MIFLKILIHYFVSLPPKNLFNSTKVFNTFAESLYWVICQKFITIFLFHFVQISPAEDTKMQCIKYVYVKHTSIKNTWVYINFKFITDIYCHYQLHKWATTRAHLIIKYHIYWSMDQKNSCPTCSGHIKFSIGHALFLSRCLNEHVIFFFFPWHFRCYLRKLEKTSNIVIHSYNQGYV